MLFEAPRPTGFELGTNALPLSAIRFDPEQLAVFVDDTVTLLNSLSATKDVNVAFLDLGPLNEALFQVFEPVGGLEFLNLPVPEQMTNAFAQLEKLLLANHKTLGPWFHQLDSTGLYVFELQRCSLPSHLGEPEHPPT